jgi:hypothetical protein
MSLVIVTGRPPGIKLSDSPPSNSTRNPESPLFPKLAEALRHLGNLVGYGSTLLGDDSGSPQVQTLSDGFAMEQKWRWTRQKVQVAAETAPRSSHSMHGLMPSAILTDASTTPEWEQIAEIIRSAQGVSFPEKGRELQNAMISGSSLDKIHPHVIPLT